MVIATSTFKSVVFDLFLVYLIIIFTLLLTSGDLTSEASDSE